VMTAVTPAVESGARSVAEQVWQRLHGETHA
jgi:hypothetical protein